MPVTFGIQPGEAAMVLLGYVDPKTQELVELAAFGFKTAGEFRQHWRMIPDSTPKTDFIADEYDAAGDLGDTKNVTGEFVEHITKRPVAELIDEGRAAVKKVMNDWNTERRAKLNAAALAAAGH